jgi:AcrR family transcriptional regulator
MGVVEPSASWKAKPEGADYQAMHRRLVAAAAAIVEESGAAALRLDAVAERVGLHRSSLYRYVDSKEELLTAVVVEASLRIGRQVIERLGPDPDPQRFLVEGLATALALLADDPIYRSLSAPGASEAMSRVGSRALTEGLRPLVEPLFAEADARGLLRDGVSPDDALRWLQVVATGLARAPDVATSTEDLTGLLERMLVPALFTIPPGPAGPRDARVRRR